MPQFRRQPQIIEAEQFLNGVWVKGMCPGCVVSFHPHVHTIHNNQLVVVEDGDWILPEPDGEHFYPVKPDIFAVTYEPV